MVNWPLSPTDAARAFFAACSIDARIAFASS
jgi:hypothetical protein